MKRPRTPRPSPPVRRGVAALAALLLILALAACTPPQDYPRGVTDSDLWERNDIRIDTEVPNQYPNGTTRGSPDEAHGDEEHADDEEH